MDGVNAENAGAFFCLLAPRRLEAPTAGTASPFQAQGEISPGMTRPPSCLCLSDLRRSVPCKYRALAFWASPRYAASIRFGFVKPALCLQLDRHGWRKCRFCRSKNLPFRFRLATDTLAVRLHPSPCRVGQGLSPSSRRNRHHSDQDSASHGATRHAWRTQKKARPEPGFTSRWFGGERDRDGLARAAIRT